MNKLGITLMVLIVAVAFCVSAEAVPDKTASVSASVSIGGTTSLSVAPSSISFGTYSVDAYPTTPADGKVVLTYTSNYNPWKVAIYTNNTQVKKVADDAEYGKYSKGGLATASGNNVIPCKWVAKKGDNAIAPTVPSKASLFNYIMDKRDEDDPATSTYNESWDTAYSAGYANIAFGDSTGGVCIDPTNKTPADPLDIYKGDAVNGSIAVYIAGLFGTGGATSAGDYSSNVYFDLYHE